MHEEQQRAGVRLHRARHVEQEHEVGIRPFPGRQFLAFQRDSYQPVLRRPGCLGDFRRDGKRPTVMRRLVVVREVVDHLLNAHRIGGRQLPFAQEPAEIRIRGRIDVDREGGQRVLGNRGHLVVGLVVVGLGVELLLDIPRRPDEGRTHFTLSSAGGRADPEQLQQVAVNLILNAVQAMPSGGDLTLKTRNVTLDEAYVRNYKVKPGNYVMLTVTDTGVGIDDRTKERIFEPFFTTREMGRGRGLGLASAYGIIRGHQGIINIYSEEGQGTTFNLFLPATEKTAVKETVPPKGLLEGNETILFVDDEEVIIEVNREILESLGYKVVAAKSGQEAIELYRKLRGKINHVHLIDSDGTLHDDETSTHAPQALGVRAAEVSQPVIVGVGEGRSSGAAPGTRPHRVQLGLLAQRRLPDLPREFRNPHRSLRALGFLDRQAAQNLRARIAGLERGNSIPLRGYSHRRRMRG